MPFLRSQKQQLLKAYFHIKQERDAATFLIKAFTSFPLESHNMQSLVQTNSKLFSCFFLQRSDIVKAAYEPTDEECEWKADEEEELTVSKQVQVTYTPACFWSY